MLIFAMGPMNDMNGCPWITIDWWWIRQPLGRGHQAVKHLILYPVSWFLWLNGIILQLSFFVCSQSASWFFRSPLFLHVWCCILHDVKILHILFGSCNGAQQAPKLPSTHHGVPALCLLWANIQSHQISSVPTDYQKSSKLPQRHHKTKQKDWNQQSR